MLLHVIDNKIIDCVKWSKFSIPDRKGSGVDQGRKTNIR